MHNIQNQRALECADVGTSAYNILLCLLQNTRNYKHASNLKRITRDAAVDTAVLVITKPAIVLQNIQHTCHLGAFRHLHNWCVAIFA
jgi:hypothetical protein